MPWHTRRSIRLKHYDYSSPGFYFLTICANGRQSLFGKVEDGFVVLSNLGKVVASVWRSLPRYFPFSRIDAFIIMPDHLHAVVEFKEGNTHSLDRLIRNFKSISTRKIHNFSNNTVKSLWQRNYYERVIRNEKELNLVRLYIDLNPRMLKEGKELNSLEFNPDEIEALLSKYSTGDL